METITKHTIWATTILLTVAIVCGTLIYLNQNAWTMRFEMDDNTKDAIESVDFERGSVNLWLPPTDNWTMVTVADDELFINGVEVGK